MKTRFKCVVWCSAPLCLTQMHFFRIVILHRGANSAVIHTANRWAIAKLDLPSSHSDVLSLKTPPFAMTAGLLLPVLVPVQWRPICADTCPSLAESVATGINLPNPDRDYRLQAIVHALFFLVFECQLLCQLLFLCCRLCNTSYRNREQCSNGRTGVWLSGLKCFICVGVHS